mmetsp:Transcript_115838/g.291420  ORF Transcript_115838/g.291420 Transcript_115838/m.291420 type:complete len:200 (-) Transcript_115838:3795-4394(-)
MAAALAEVVRHRRHNLDPVPNLHNRREGHVEVNPLLRIRVVRARPQIREGLHCGVDGEARGCCLVDEIVGEQVLVRGKIPRICVWRCGLRVPDVQSNDIHDLRLQKLVVPGEEQPSPARVCVVTFTDHVVGKKFRPSQVPNRQSSVIQPHVRVREDLDIASCGDLEFSWCCDPQMSSIRYVVHWLDRDRHQVHCRVRFA